VKQCSGVCADPRHEGDRLILSASDIFTLRMAAEAVSPKVCVT
jgi:hypothetical protein